MKIRLGLEDRFISQDNSGNILSLLKLYIMIFSV